MSFRVGDRVVVTKQNADGASVNIGDVGTVIEARNPENLVVDMDGSDGAIWHFGSEHLELFYYGGEVHEAEGNTGPHLHFEHDVTLSSLARVANETGVMVSLTVYPAPSDSEE